MTLSAANLNGFWADLIVEELIRNQIDYFCLSPGSRSTPLALSAARHGQARKFIHFDERGMSFHALGYAMATGQPAALICTSATAVANYMPAVVEASMNMVPLILLSADRPPELRDCCANQAIDQVKIFGSFVQWHIDLPCPDDRIPPQFVLTAIDQAVYQAVRSPKGPVHINCMFREPLVAGQSVENLAQPVDLWRKSGEPYTSYSKPVITADTATMKRVAGIIEKVIENAGQGLFVIGGLPPYQQRDQTLDAVVRLSEKLGWPVIADIGSGLKVESHTPNLIAYSDYVIPVWSDLAGGPSVVVQIGDRVVSKRLLDFLKDAPLKEYIVITDHPFRSDPSHQVTIRVEGEIKTLCHALEQMCLCGSCARVHPAVAMLNEASDLSGRIVKEVLAENARAFEQISEPACAQLVAGAIKDDSALFVANSMPIRDMDRFALRPGAATIPIGCNRGASGIDGTIASAAGFLAGIDRPLTLIIGDLSFLHDLNSLAMIKSLPHALIIVLINNNGGGIFSFLPISLQKDFFESYFATPHGLSFQKAGEMFGLKYYSPETEDAFAACYRQAQEAEESAIIEVKTNRAENRALHELIEKRVAETLGHWSKTQSSYCPGLPRREA